MPYQLLLFLRLIIVIVVNGCSGGGSRLASITGSGYVEPGINNLALSGSASITISRVGSDITINWDGVPILTGTSAAPVRRVEISFSHESVGGTVAANNISLTPQ